MSKVKVTQKDVQYFKNLFEQDVVLNGQTEDVFTPLCNHLKNEKNIIIVEVETADFETLYVLDDSETIEGVYTFQGVETETEYFDEFKLTVKGYFTENSNALVIDNILLDVEEPII